MLMDNPEKWDEVYSMLADVSTLPYDCGTLCGCRCCISGEGDGDTGIYLYPGEYEYLLSKGMIADSDEKTGKKGFLSVSSGTLGKDAEAEKEGEDRIYVKCKGPYDCIRRYRPLQCSTFPLKPVINEMGVLELIWSDDELPYECPVIENNMPVHDDFYRAVYNVWAMLIHDDRFFEMASEW